MTGATQEFRILACLGRGGFGEVYHAQKLAEGGFRKDVALKVLNANMARVDDVANRLKDEARILGLLNHRAIVTVDLLTRLDGRWTVVMEYVEGADLREILDAVGSLPLHPVLGIGAEVASALDYAYNHAVLDPDRPGAPPQPLHLRHRDIKPSNIQLTPRGDVKVLDFGIAKAEFESREAVTGTNLFMTPEYAAPERLRGIEHPGGDVFSLGAVLVELLLGRTVNLVSPYLDAMLAGEALDLETYQNRSYGQLAAELASVRGMSRPTRDLLLAMLAWNPELRPAPRLIARLLRSQAADTEDPEEPFQEWCERVVSPLVRARQRNLAGGPRRANPHDLTGQTLRAERDPFPLVDAQTVLMPAASRLPTPPPPAARGTPATPNTPPPAARRATPPPEALPPRPAAQSAPAPPTAGAPQPRTPSRPRPAVEPEPESRTLLAAGAPLLLLLIPLVGLATTLGLWLLWSALTPLEPGVASSVPRSAEVAATEEGPTSDEGSTAGSLQEASKGASTPRAVRSPATTPSPPADATATPSRPQPTADREGEQGQEPTSAAKAKATPRSERGGAPSEAAEGTPTVGTGLVRHLGDAESLLLVPAIGSMTYSVPPNGRQVPAGKYQVYAVFDGERTLVASMEVTANETLSLRCMSLIRSCRKD